jgi:co-chaperonin GroES (HSP10)
MRVSKDTFLVEVQDQFQRPNIAGFDFIDTDYNPKLLATKIGKIHTLPITLTTSDAVPHNIKLEVGDTVVFNHMVCQDKNKFQENIFFCDYFNIYALILDDKVFPLEEVFFAEPIIENGVDIGCFHVEDKVSDKIAKVFEVSKVCAESGIQKGDIIFFTKNADYPIEIAGKELYKMHLRNVIGIERDGKLTCFRNKLLVKNVTELGKVGDIQRIYAHNSLQEGIVVNSGNVPDLIVGEKVTYFEAIATAITWKGESYSFIQEENIKWKQ